MRLLILNTARLSAENSLVTYSNTCLFCVMNANVYRKLLIICDSISLHHLYQLSMPRMIPKECVIGINDNIDPGMIGILHRITAVHCLSYDDIMQMPLFSLFPDRSVQTMFRKVASRELNISVDKKYKLDSEVLWLLITCKFVAWWIQFYYLGAVMISQFIIWWWW